MKQRAELSLGASGVEGKLENARVSPYLKDVAANGLKIRNPSSIFFLLRS